MLFSHLGYTFAPCALDSHRRNRGSASSELIRPASPTPPHLLYIVVSCLVAAHQARVAVALIILALGAHIRR
jgi:hypothetical protein